MEVILGDSFKHWQFRNSNPEVILGDLFPKLVFYFWYKLEYCMNFNKQYQLKCLSKLPFNFKSISLEDL